MLHSRLFKQAWASKSSLIIVFGLGLLSGGLVISQARLFSRIVEAVFLEGKTLPEAAGWLAGILVILAMRGLCTWGNAAAADRVASKTKIELRTRLFDHILALGAAFTSGERTGELVNTLVEGVEALDAYYREYLPQVVITALMPGLLLIFIFPIDWISGLILLLSGPLIPIFMILIGGLTEGLAQKQWQSLSRMSAHFLDVIQGLPTLKMLGRSKEQIKVIAQVSERHRKTTLEVLQVAFLSAFTLELLSTLGTALVAVGIGLRLLYGRLLFEDALFVLLLAPEFYLPLRMLGARFHAGTAGLAGAERIYSVLDLPVPQAANTDPSRLRSSSAFTQPKTIRFSDICFTFPGSGQPALHHLHLTIPAGQITALVGPSGAGKSTAASLLLRFLEPTSGTIQVDNQPIAEIGPDAWRQNIGWVSQRPYLFHDTVAENIRLARPSASQDEVKEAAQKARLHDFIKSLPDGYQTVIGERGSRLSGGQAQRLAVARAFLKDAPILILDEATANLDPELEDEIQSTVAELAAGRTVLLIAHRLHTAARADHLIVLQGGQAVQLGTHAELSKTPGLYREMWKAFETGAGSFPHRMGNDAKGSMLEPRKEQIPSWPSLETNTWSVETEPFDIRSARSSMKFLLRLLAPHWRAGVAAILLGFLTIASSVGLMATSAYIISAAALQPSIAVIQIPIVGVRFFGLSRGVFRYFERLAAHHTTFKILSDLRVWAYTRLEPLAPARLMYTRSGDLLSRLISDIGKLENLYLRGVFPSLTAILTGAATGLLMLAFDFRLTLVVWGFMLLAGLGVPFLIRVQARGLGAAANTQQVNLNAALVDSLQGLADLMANNAELRQREKIRSIGQKMAAAQNQLARLDGLQAALHLVAANLAMWSVTLLAIPLVGAGKLEGVFLATAALATLSAFEAIQPLGQAFVHMESSLHAAHRLVEIPAPPAAETRRATATPARPFAPTAFALTVKDLTFAYPGSDQNALKGLCLDLPAGGRAALVGPSGAGKSTLVSLLLKFWEEYEGKLELFGQELRNLDPDDARSHLSVVSQQTHLFNTSIRENLLLARPAATQAELEEACETAQIHNFIISLPNGYDTITGEQGLRFSGGERQRLAIARAMLKNAPLLVLDEVTANLDAQNERAVLEILSRTMNHRSVLHLTHRLVGLEHVDEILVIQEGRVVERGSLSELLAHDGWFTRMWRLQHSEPN